METIIDLDSLLTYRKDIQNLIAENSPKVKMNESIAHAAIVHSLILDNARENHWPVNMYCGELSIYQDNTKEEIEAMVPDLKGKPDSDHPYICLMKSLSNFFAADGHMNVILDNPISGLSNQNLWQYIKTPLENGQLNVRILASDFGIKHFTVAGGMYRCEISHKKKDAFCCFNSQKAETLKKGFETLSLYTKDIAVN